MYGWVVHVNHNGLQKRSDWEKIVKNPVPKQSACNSLPASQNIPRAFEETSYNGISMIIYNVKKPDYFFPEKI